MNPDRPEQNVIDAIDALVDEQLRNPQNNYNALYAERCDLCHQEWHGLPSELTGCPGAYATNEQRADWHPIDSVWSQVTILTGFNLEDIGDYLDHIRTALPQHDSDMPYPYHEHVAPPAHSRCAQCQRHLPRGPWVGPPGTPTGLCEECHHMQQPRSTQHQLGQGNSR